MAYVKIKQIRTTPARALLYIMNEKKTEEQLYISGYQVDPYCADLEFLMTQKIAENELGKRGSGKGKTALAYHMIQSFAPYDKITAQEAHELGKQWADEILGGKYEYVISTHVDRGHLHNHIIFNATSFFDYKKFRSEPYKTVRKLREVSDQLCREHGLYVIPETERQETYPLYQGKTTTSYRVLLAQVIDQELPSCSCFEELISRLTERKIGVRLGKHIAFRLPNQKRYSRGKSIGEGYTKEGLEHRIQAQQLSEENPFRTALLKLYKSNSEGQIKTLSEYLLLLDEEKIKKMSDFDRSLAQLEEKIEETGTKLRELEEKLIYYRGIEKILCAYQEQKAMFQTTGISGKKREYRLFEKQKKKLLDLEIDPDADVQRIHDFIENQRNVLDLMKNRKKRIYERKEKLVQIKERLRREVRVMSRTKEKEK